MSENDVGFFVNLEKEAAAAKLVHLGNPQTALVTQKIPFCRGNRQKGKFSVPYLGYVLSAS